MTAERISRSDDERSLSSMPVDLAELQHCHHAFMRRVDRAAVPLAGVDFTSAPRRAKPITVALGSLDVLADKPCLTVGGLLELDSFAAFEAWLAQPEPRLTGFDLPFGLPREFVMSQNWPTDWVELMSYYASHSRDELRERFKAFCASRPVGHKFAHRHTDGPARSSPSMKWVNPPVAWMMHAGVPRLLAANLTLPGQHAGDPARIALEAYPAMLARTVTHRSYKSDRRAAQSPARRDERRNILVALQAGRSGPAGGLRGDAAMFSSLLDDGSGDRLDAVLCMVQASLAVLRNDADLGLAPGFDRLEGWITGAGN